MAMRIFLLLRLVSAEQERLLQKRAALEEAGAGEVDAALEDGIQQWELCSALVYAVLDDLSQLLTLSEFVTIVSELLRHDDPQVCAVFVAM
jgi:hypothetical protein